MRFQSTLPSRGATWRLLGWLSRESYFNPRSPRGERPMQYSFNRGDIIFQSTLPSRGATCARHGTDTGYRISIHAPLAGSDNCNIYKDSGLAEISIHAPLAGSDQSQSVQPNPWKQFQSTLPSRGATKDLRRFRDQFSISIHAPLAGSDVVAGHTIPLYRLFQSTLPSRGATFLPASFLLQCKDFNPRSPRGERRNLF